MVKVVVSCLETGAGLIVAVRMAAVSHAIATAILDMYC
jgi:hypothetical protein